MNEQSTNIKGKTDTNEKLDIINKNNEIMKDDIQQTKITAQDIPFILEQILITLQEQKQEQKESFELSKTSIEKFIEQQAKRDEEVKGKDAISRGKVEIKKYTNYYDRNFTIPQATTSDPNDFDSASYQTATIFKDIERYADRINVIVDGNDTLYAVISHGGETNFSKEEPIYPGEVKTFYNVYEMRFRSKTAGVTYRVTEYDIDKVCCPTATGTASNPEQVNIRQNKSVKNATGSIAATASIVAAVSGKKIKVTAYSLITSSTTAVTSTFNDGAGGTAKWTVPLQALASTISGANLSTTRPDCLFETTAGNALELALSAAQTVTYSISYFDDDAT